MGRIQRILIAAPQWVGDTLFMLPAVSALRRKYPKARISLLARPGLAALVSSSPLFDERHSYEGRGRLPRFLAHAARRGDKNDLAITFSPSFSSGLALWLSGASLRLGHGGQARFLFLNRRLPRKAADRSRHVVEEYLDLARLAGAKPLPEDKRVSLPLTQAGVEEQARLFHEHHLKPGPTLVALCPSSAFGPSKRWGPEKYGALGKALKAKGYSPFVLAAPFERAEADEVALLAGGIPVLTPGLPGLAACLQKSAAVVANDSGPLHLASAVGSRVLGIYGPVDPSWSGPLAKKSAVLYSDEPCSPCHAQVCPLGHHDCMNHLSVAMALESLMKLLKR